jgi:hypothetical protein
MQPAAGWARLLQVGDGLVWSASSKQALVQEWRTPRSASDLREPGVGAPAPGPKPIPIPLKSVKESDTSRQARHTTDGVKAAELLPHASDQLILRHTTQATPELDSLEKRKGDKVRSGSTAAQNGWVKAARTGEAPASTPTPTGLTVQPPSPARSRLPIASSPLGCSRMMATHRRDYSNSDVEQSTATTAAGPSKSWSDSVRCAKRLFFTVPPPVL